MKNLKALGLLLLALFFGLAAALYASAWVARQGNVASNELVVAAIDIELGSRIQPQMLTRIAWPSASVPAGAFTDVELLNERVTKVAILKGEPILEPKLAPQGTRGGLSAVIAQGKRAMTVRVNDVVGVAGFALPGNYVDVMVNTDHETAGRTETRRISKTVLEHVLVLAVAQEANRDDTKPRVVSAVTLEVTPMEAERLDLARSVGQLSLVLRNQIDKNPVATAGATKQELFGIVEPVRPPVVQARRAPVPQPVVHRPASRSGHCIEVIQNGQRSLNCFPQ